jgi:chloride channel protein, CIC family
MLGAALGGLLGAILPDTGEGTWALIGMAAAMAAAMRSPFTSIVFALELTHDVNALLALLIACTIAHLVSVLTLKRSILTKKIARRGYHVTREYEIDPLHALLVRDAMATEVLTVRPQTPTEESSVRAPTRGQHRAPPTAAPGDRQRRAPRRCAGILRCDRRVPVH